MSFIAALPSPWHVFERIRGQAAVEVVWRGYLGDDFEPLLISCLEPAPQPAEFVPCPAGCGCAHRVQTGDGEWAVAVCCCDPCNCADLRVSMKDLVIWRLDWTRLGRRLCTAFELWPRAADLGIPGTRQIGVWSAAAVPVWLSVHNSAQSFRAAMAELSSRLKRPFVLFTPTGQFVDAFCEELFAHAAAAWFSLEACAAIEVSGGVRPRITPGKLFSRFQPTVEESRREIAEQAIELLVRLDSELGLKPPSLVTVFKLACRDALSAERIARKCGCSKATVINRLSLLKERTGLSSAQMRQISSHLEDGLEATQDSRASRLHRRRLANESPDEAS